MERKTEFKCYHEPFSSPFYFGPNRLSSRYATHELPQDERRYSTIEDVVATISNEAAGRRIFLKDMATHIVSPTDGSIVLPPEFLQKLLLTFLIRSPRKAIPSLNRMCSGHITGWSYFDPLEAGYQQQRILFDYLRGTSPETPPIVVDSDSLLQDPAGVMEAYCQAVGVEFRHEMIQWDAGPVEEFSTWPGFHADVENSTGLGQVMKTLQREVGDEEDLPEHVLHCIDENQGSYEYLKGFELRPTNLHCTKMKDDEMQNAR